MIKLKNLLKHNINEGVTPEAARIHSLTNCGQDAAQDFIDDNNIDATKLVTYLQQNKQANPTLVYDVRDYISGAKGTVGGEKNLRDRFIKQFQMQ